MTVKLCNQLAAGGQRSGVIKFTEVFSFIFSMICLVSFPQVVQEQKLGEVAGGNLNNQSTASGVGNT